MATFDTSIYRQAGPGGLAALAQGFMQGMQLADARRAQQAQLQMQQEQFKMQQEAQRLQREMAQLDQMRRTREIQQQLFQQLGETAGNLLSIQDPVQQQAEYQKVRENLITSGLARPQELPESFQAARGQIEFYHNKYRQAQEKAELEKQFVRSQIAKNLADARQKQAVGAAGAAGLPKPPAGYRWKADLSGVEPIPGSPQAQKLEAQKEIGKLYSNILVQDANRALEILESVPWSTGSWFGKLKHVPGSAAYELDQLLQSVRSNVSFEKLQAMRAASPTGGALGNVSNQELAMLEAAVGTLRTDVPTHILADNLKRVINLQLDIIHGPGQGPPRYQLSFDEQGRPIARNQNKPRRSLLGTTRAQATQPNVNTVPKFKTNQIEWAD